MEIIMSWIGSHVMEILTFLLVCITGVYTILTRRYVRLTNRLNNVPVIILADGGEFTAVGRAGDPGDIPITGGQAFILTAQYTSLVTFSGPGWE